MKTLEIVVDGEIPYHCGLKCNYCMLTVRRLTCLAIKTDVTECIEMRHEDCPLVAWQGSEDGGVPEINNFLAMIGRKLIIVKPGVILVGNFLWRPLPKMPEA